MATGFFDSNGIWNYGEDDNIALFSDTLNKLADSTSDAFTADRARISTLEAGSLSGLIPIKPPTISVAGGTASTTDLGLVTFTSATALTLTNVFTTAYKNYRILISSSSSTGMLINGRFSQSGTPLSSGYYAGIGRAAGNVYDNYSMNNGAFMSLALNGSTQAGSGNISLDVYHPQQTGWSSFTFIGTGFDGTYGVTIQGGGNHQVSSQNDGFYLYPSTGNITGTIQVLGYND